MSGPSSSAAASSPKAASSPLAKDQVCSATKEELLASNQTYNVLTPCPLCNSRGTKLSIGLHRSGKAPAPSAPGSISDLEWQNLCNPYSGKWNVEAYVALRGLDDQARRMAFHHMVDAGDSEETLQRFVLDARGAKRKRNEAHHGSGKYSKSAPALRVEVVTGVASPHPAGFCRVRRSVLSADGSTQLDTFDAQGSPGPGVKAIAWWNLHGLNSASAKDPSAAVWGDIARATRTRMPDIFVWSESNRVENTVVEALRSQLSDDYDIHNVATTEFLYFVRKKHDHEVKAEVIDEFDHKMLRLSVRCSVPTSSASSAIASFDVYGAHLKSDGTESEKLANHLLSLTQRLKKRKHNRVYFALGGDWNVGPKTILGHLRDLDKGAADALDGPRVPPGVSTMTKQVTQRSCNDNVVGGPYNKGSVVTECGGFLFRQRSDKAGVWKLDEWKDVSDHFPVWYTFAIEHIQ